MQLSTRSVISGLSRLFFLFIYMFKNSVHKTNTCWSVAILAQDRPIGGSFAPVGQIAFVECMSQALVIAAADVDFYHTGVFLDSLPQSILVATLVLGVIL